MKLSDLEDKLWLRAVIASGEARRLRLENDVTLTDVGSTCGVTYVAVHHWETGQRVPRGAPALRYARVLRMLASASKEAS